MFINSDEAVLLGLRSSTKGTWPDYWDIIGGHVENGENLDDALLRETEEEVGVVPRRFKLVATFKERQPEIHGDALHHVYAVTSWEGGDPTNVCDEHTELRWFSMSELFLLKNIADVEYPRIAQLAVADKA